MTKILLPPDLNTTVRKVSIAIRQHNNKLAGEIIKDYSERYAAYALSTFMRCPKATNHNNECTNSNEPGQKGSVYE